MSLTAPIRLLLLAPQTAGGIDSVVGQYFGGDLSSKTIFRPCTVALTSNQSCVGGTDEEIGTFLNASVRAAPTSSMHFFPASNAPAIKKKPWITLGY